jgi:hypothetical protein
MFSYSNSFCFQILVSPGYGRNEYPGGLECLYIMKAPQVTKNFLHKTFPTFKPVILFDIMLLTTPSFGNTVYVLPLYGEYICYKTEDSKI